MPTELVVIGGFLVAAAGGLCFLFLHRLLITQGAALRSRETKIVGTAPQGR